jgi:hypothetical protein
MVITPGSYNTGVPDPTDTSTADPSALSNFDQLTSDDSSQYGVSPAIANIPVPWARVPAMADSPDGGEVPAYPSRQTLQTQTYQDSMRGLYALKGEQVGNLQQRMLAAGFMGRNPDYVANAQDTKTHDTWDKILKQAMRSGRTPDEILTDAINANGGLEAGLKRFGGPAPGTLSDIHLTHPDDIRMVAKQVSTKTLGRGWSNEQLDHFVKTYQAMQSQAGRAAQGSGATVTNAPDIGAAAEAEARRQDPTAAGATDADNIMQMVMQSFKTLGGG